VVVVMVTVLETRIAEAIGARSIQS
jgi:hypothetical protein